MLPAVESIGGLGITFCPLHAAGSFRFPHQRAGEAGRGVGLGAKRLF